DPDGNIYISSLTPAQIQINGRDMRMSAADLATLLKNLPPNAISRIEIVRTPSARYDASSSGGVVNVVLKKGIRLGVTGSVTAGFQQGSYGNQFAGFNLNNNDGKTRSFVNLNYNRRNNYERIATDRLFAPDSLLQQMAYTVYPGSSLSMNSGLTRELGTKWTLELDLNLNRNTFSNQTENGSRIETVSTRQTLSDNLTRVDNTGRSWNLGTGVETKYKIDTLGSEWTTDTYFYHSESDNDQTFRTESFSPFAGTFGGDGIVGNERSFLTLRTDWKQKWNARWVFETGVKTTTLHFRNAADYFREFGGDRSKDAARTSAYRYQETIHSGYLQASKTLGKDLVLKAGTRLENTRMTGRQRIPFDTTFRIRRTDLFPYLYLSKSLFKIAGYDLRGYLVYRRTIVRPGYEQLNPFPRYVDAYLTESGNPRLRPQFNRNYEANISVDERPIVAVGINETTDIFTGVIYQADSARSQALRTIDNVGRNREWYFRGIGAIPPGKKYFFVAGAQYNHNFYRGQYENRPLSFRRGTWTFFTYHTLKLGTRSVATLNGFLRLRGQQQFYELGSFGALNTSINRKFLRDKLILTLSMNDMFFTNQNTFRILQGTIDANGTRVADSRRFGLNIRFNFGIRKKEEKSDPFDTPSAEGQQP
ncbi:MAG: hypothetical protein RJA57_1104, partial [Bacteroidota bacterium]